MRNCEEVMEILNNFNSYFQKIVNEIFYLNIFTELI
jgi:hypothetical protein